MKLLLFISFIVILADLRLNEVGVKDLDKVKLKSEFDPIWLDYARVIVSGLWKRLNPESMEKNKTKIGPSMINRSWPHVLFITRRLCRLLL